MVWVARRTDRRSFNQNRYKERRLYSAVLCCPPPFLFLSSAICFPFVVRLLFPPSCSCPRWFVSPSLSACCPLPSCSCPRRFVSPLLSACCTPPLSLSLAVHFPFVVSCFVVDSLLFPHWLYLLSPCPCVSRCFHSPDRCFIAIFFPFICPWLFLVVSLVCDGWTFVSE